MAHDVDVATIFNAVRRGMGLQQAIERTGLPLKETLLWLQSNRVNEYREAKKEHRPTWRPRG